MKTCPGEAGGMWAAPGLVLGGNSQLWQCLKAGWLFPYSFGLPKFSTGSAESWLSSHFLLIPFSCQFCQLTLIIILVSCYLSLNIFLFFFSPPTFFSPHHLCSLCFRFDFISSSKTSSLISFSSYVPFSVLILVLNLNPGGQDYTGNPDEMILLKIELH